MVIYQKRVLHLLQEFSYLIYSTRRKGLLAVVQTANLDGFEPVVRAIVAYGLQLLECGMTPERARMFLELKKISAWKDPDMTAEDLKIIQLSIESFFYIQSGDLEDYRAFTWYIFDLEGNSEDRELFSQLLSVLRKAEEEKHAIDKQELNSHIQKIAKESVKPQLSQEEIVTILGDFGQDTIDNP